jgi:hypothetical protein
MANQKTFNNAKKTNQTKTLYNSSRLVLNQNIIHPKQIGCIQLPDATLNKSLRQPNLQVFRSIEPCLEKDCKMQPPLPLFFLRMEYLFYISITFMRDQEATTHSSVYHHRSTTIINCSRLLTILNVIFN